MSLIDVALVTLLGLIAVGLWWLAAWLEEREKRRTQREAHEQRIALADVLMESGRSWDKIGKWVKRLDPDRAERIEREHHQHPN